MRSLSALFAKGVKLKHNKLTEHSGIKYMTLPERLYFPVLQHIGKPSEPIVNKGDKVKQGQVIAKASSFVSSNIHSSADGEIEEIKDTPHPITGKPVKTIIIKTSEENNIDEDKTAGKQKEIKAKSEKNAEKKDKKTTEIIRDSGVVGLGGAAFPTDVKLSPPPDKKIDTLIINGAECEPYLTSDHRLMLENTREIIEGILISANALNVNSIYIGIEKNKKDAIKKIKSEVEIKIKEDNLKKRIKVVSLQTMYPQGAEKTLITRITGKKVPSGKLPMDAGCVVQNVSTSYALFEAIELNKPLYERVVSVTGRVKNPGNYIVKNGTLVKDIIQHAGGYSCKPDDVGKIISGGPMMGIALKTTDLPVLKATSGILVFSKDDIKEQDEKECIRCAACVKHCPVGLHPVMIAKHSMNKRYDLAEKAYAMDCIECGCCSYTCPSKIPLLHWIRIAKDEIRKSGIKSGK